MTQSENLRDRQKAEGEAANVESLQANKDQSRKDDADEVMQGILAARDDNPNEC